MNSTYPFINTPLPYAFNALEPYIDAKTMELHHNRHLQTYIDNLNKILKENPQLQALTLKQLINNWYRLPADIAMEVRNNGGGVFNHRFYFKIIGPPVTNTADNQILNKIKQQFGSMESFKEKFKASAMSVFGSGYTWLVLNSNTLQILKTPNQNTPDLNIYTPILNIDVWEHAYYLKHYNLRGDYVEDWFKIVDWNKVNMLYLAQIQSCLCSANKRC